MKISNTSNSSILFKVKTTQPKWYHVRPWQQTLGKGKSITVEIVFCDSERQKKNKESVQHLKNRFMIEHIAISDESAMYIESSPASDKATAFTNTWSKQSGAEIFRSKLNVLFDNVENTERTNGDAAALSAYERIRIENIENNTKFLESLGISSSNDSIKEKKSKVSQRKAKVVAKATRKLPDRENEVAYDPVNFQFGDICKGETVQLKNPTRYGRVVRVVKGRRSNVYTVRLDNDDSIVENLSRSSLWKVLKPVK